MDPHETGHGMPLGARLPRRRLGRVGIEVPAVALGCYPLGTASSERDAIETVQYAVQQGVTHLDTSPAYGDSERRIGVALRGVPRDGLTISTKTGTHPERRGDYTRDATLWSVENSLRQLGTDYLDVVLVHDPERTYPDGLDPVLEPGMALEALEELVTQGVIGAIGLGQGRFEYARVAIESGRFDMILTYDKYHPLDTRAAEWLLPLAAEHDVGVFNGSPMSHGLLSGVDPDEVVRGNPRRFGRRPECEIEAARRLVRWCGEKGVRVPAVVFGFCIRQPLVHCTLTGAETRDQMARNLAAATTTLPESLWEELAALDLEALYLGH